MRTPSGTAALAGGVAMAFALLVVLLVSESGVPFPPVALGQAIVEALPGAVSVPLIELLQHWAQRLLILGVLLLFLADGAATAAVALQARVASLAVVGLGTLPWVVTVAAAQILAGAKVDLGTDLFASAVGAAAFFAALAFLLGAERVATPAGASRRRFLVGAVAVAGVVALGSTALGATLRAGRKVASVALEVRHLRSREAVADADPSFAGIDHLTPRVTSNEQHYEVDTALIKPSVDIATWRLAVAGDVEHPYALTWDQLLDLPAVERPHTLECISNEIGGDLTSTAVWSGVPLADLLARAAPKADAYDVVITSVDGYSDSFRVQKAVDPDTLVAYLMNGVTIPEEHGYPARVLVPGIYGMKNVKWLTKVEVASYDFQGYWQQRGWSDVATYNTHVRIDAPGATARAAGGRVTIAGIAFAGDRGIQRVEVSTDGGTTWTDAALEAPVGRQTWRRWRLDRPLASGRYRVVARATDGQGQVQTSVQRPPFPDGSTGWHAVDVSVVS